MCYLDNVANVDFLILEFLTNNCFQHSHRLWAIELIRFLLCFSGHPKKRERRSVLLLQQCLLQAIWYSFLKHLWLATDRTTWWPQCWHWYCYSGLHCGFHTPSSCWRWGNGGFDVSAPQSTKHKCTDTDIQSNWGRWCFRQCSNALIILM